MRKRLLSILLLCCMVLTLLPTAALAADDVAINDTNFPDEKFREYVKTEFDEDNNNSLSADEIAKAKDIHLAGKGISSLAGVEHFTNLEELDVQHNEELTTLNLSKNTELKTLKCSNTKLTSLDTSHNKKLVYLQCDYIPTLTTLNVSENKDLKTLYCKHNALTALDLTNNSALEKLECGDNELTTLDLSKNTELKYFGCFNSKLSSLDLTNNTNLEELYFCGNNVSNIDVSENTKLKFLHLFGNQLITLDTSKNSNLQRLWVYTNPLTSMYLGDSGSTMEVKFDNLPYPIKVSTATRTFDLSTLPTGFDVSKASNWAGGRVDGNILTVDENAATVTYLYDCGERQATYGTPETTGKLMMTCTLQVNWVPAPAITEDDLAGLNIPANLVTVKCQTTGDSKAYGRIPGGFDLSNATPYMDNGVLKAIVKINLSAYKDKYDADTKKTHEKAGLEGNTHAAFTLKYVNDKWELDGTFPNVVILVKCYGQHPQTPPYPTEENVSGLEQVQVRVQCCTDTAQFKNYGILPGSVSIMPDPNNPSQATLTLIPSVYSTQYSTDTGITHIVDSSQTTDNLKIQMRYDPAVGKWMPAGVLTPLVIYVKCNNHDPQTPPYPTEENVGGLERVQVRVQCSTDTAQFKNYGILPGSVSIMPDANNPSQATLTLIPSVYSKQYTIDTGITHSVAPNQATDNLKIQMRYNSAVGKWMPAGELTPLEVLVQCNNHQGQRYTITFNGNGGTPSVTSMTTIDQKLPELPTATHSGRYSFDGWYTAASGGTKITTATVFYENTTVHAHWTYIGGGGSSGGGGGYTYHTIRAISGLNGSVSPSGWTSVRHGWDQTFTITPDKGYAVAKVLVDGKSVGSVKSYTFKNVTKDHTIEVVFMKANGNPQTGVFVDVPEGSYYEEAVDWAVEKGITTGTGNNYFTPDGICTRAQAVTFLWRVAGSPTPKTEAMVFEDVLDGSYYYEAVLWAVENGITVGTSATTFSPELTCSRAHIVTFLWRAANSPSARTVNPFTDVAADAYYIDAVLWAVKHKITVGTTLSTFSPDEGCTRAQIVTFLYRAHSK